MATTVSKFSGGVCPQTPRAFFILNMLQNNSSKKKMRFEIYFKIWCPFTKKISEYAAYMKTFFKGLFTSFLGLTLYLVNIQSNSKFHLPPQSKFFGFSPECGIEFFYLEPPPL